MKRYRIQLHLLSPLHIGTGEELTPTDYIIRTPDGNKQRPILYALDIPKLLGQMSDADRQSFNEAASSNNPAHLRRWLHERVDVKRYARWYAYVNRELYECYQDGLQSAKSELAIHPIIRTSLSSQPYIPGSTVKGAIRTAVLQYLLNSQEGQAEKIAQNKAYQNSRNFTLGEAAILGHLTRPERQDRSSRRKEKAEIRADPFRAVYISDLFYNQPNTPAAPAQSVEPTASIFTIVNKVDLFSLESGNIAASRRKAPLGIHMFYEMTFSALNGREVIAQGTLTIKDELSSTDAHRAKNWNFEHCVSRSISAADILKSCQQFYSKRLKEEAELTSKIPNASRAYNQLQRMANSLNHNHEALIRLGRFSHVECVTLEPPLRRARGGKSRTMTPGPLPMGWAILRLDLLE